MSQHHQTSSRVWESVYKMGDVSRCLNLQCQSFCLFILNASKQSKVVPVNALQLAHQRMKSLSGFVQLAVQPQEETSCFGERDAELSQTPLYKFPSSSRELLCLSCHLLVCDLLLSKEALNHLCSLHCAHNVYSQPLQAERQPQ